MTGHFVGQINAVLDLDLRLDPIRNRVVPVVATKLGVPRSRKNFEGSIANIQNRDIESATAKVEDQDFTTLIGIYAEGQAGRGRFINNTNNVESSDGTGIFGRLTLSIVEVSRNRNDRLFDWLAKVLFGIALHIGEDFGRDFLRGDIFIDAVNVEFLRTAHLSLRAGNGIRVGDRLTLCRVANNFFPTCLESNDGRGRIGSFRIGDDFHIPVCLTIADDRIGRAKVNANNNFFCHSYFSPF